MNKQSAIEIYKSIKNKNIQYDADYHCPLLLEVMADKDRGTFTAFCVEAHIGKTTFYKWLDIHKEFGECYDLGRAYQKENWEEEGRKIREEYIAPGCSSPKMDYWKMIGNTRFGFGRNEKIRINLNPESNPLQNYKELIEQARNGEFSASEMKQLMEAINVGINTHQVFEMQHEIDRMKEDMILMKDNVDANNTFTNKAVEKKD